MKLDTEILNMHNSVLGEDEMDGTLYCSYWHIRRDLSFQ